MDSHRRSIVKALTYRFLGLLVTSSVAWFITGKVEFAAKIGILDFILKIFSFYIHERLWLRSSFGKLKDPDYQI